MASFLKDVEKKALAALKVTKGFNFNVSCYEGAASFEDALKLFFTNLNRDLRELVEIHALSATASLKSKLSKGEAIKKIVNFYATTATTLNTHIIDFASLIKLDTGLNTLAKKQAIQKKKIEFAATLEASFALLREETRRYLALVETLDLKEDLDVKILQAFNTFENLTFAKFLNLTTSGKKIPWLPDDEH